MKRNQIINLINEMKRQNIEELSLLSLKFQEEKTSLNPNNTQIMFLNEDIKHFESMNFGLSKLQDALWELNQI
tara:strand:- start:295 stop:513 length:219 start_codon:yes stop_codon:yes gene_type:complete